MRHSAQILLLTGILTIYSLLPAVLAAQEKPVLLVDPCAFNTWEHPPVADLLVWYELHGAVEREALFVYHAESIAELDRMGRSFYVKPVENFGRVSIEIFEKDVRCSYYDYLDSIRSHYGIMRGGIDSVDLARAFSSAKYIAMTKHPAGDTVYEAFIDSAVSANLSSFSGRDIGRQLHAIYSKARAVVGPREPILIQDRYRTYLFVEGKGETGNAVGIVAVGQTMVSIPDTVTRAEYLNRSRWDSIRKLNDEEIVLSVPMDVTFLPTIRSWEIAGDSALVAWVIDRDPVLSSASSLRIYAGAEVPDLDEMVDQSLHILSEFLDDYTDPTWPSCSDSSAYREVFRSMIDDNLTVDSVTFRKGMTDRFALVGGGSDFEEEIEALRSRVNALMMEPRLDRWRLYAVFSEDDNSSLRAALFVPPSGRKDAHPTLLSRRQLIESDDTIPFPTGLWSSWYKMALAELEHDIRTGACGTYRLHW